MFVVNDDLSIYATRGDIVCLNVSAEDDSTGNPYEFQPGDIVRMKIFGKKDAESVYLSKDFPVVAKTNSVGVMLTEQDTKIGDVISKPTDYWYEIELNPYTNPQTIVGYDEDGAKIFKLFPEGKDLVDEPTDPEDIPVVDTDLDLTSSRPVENKAIARAVTLLKNDLEAVDARLTGKIKENKDGNKALNEALIVERTRIDNLIKQENVSLSQPLEYLEEISADTKSKVDGHIKTDGVFATITVNWREANQIYGGTALNVFVIPDKCRPMEVGKVHAEDGLEYNIYYGGSCYHLSIEAQSSVAVAPSSAGTVTFTYALGDYELKDIRVDAYGKKHGTAGEAVREQIKGLAKDVLSDFAKHGGADKFISNVEIYTDEYENILISDIRNGYIDSFGFSVFSCDENGENFVTIRAVHGLDTKQKRVVAPFGTNSILVVDFDVTGLEIGTRYTDVGLQSMVKPSCIHRRTLYNEIYAVKDRLDSLVTHASIGLFEKMGVIGDSFASGEIYVEYADGTYSGKDYYNLSWGQIIAREHGMSCQNYSSGGLTTKTWLTSNMGLPLLLADAPQQLYVFALGINDVYKLGLDYLGTINDITANYENNPDTFYGNYGRIIEQVKAHAPNSKLILSTLAETRWNCTAYNEAIIEIAEHYGIPCIKQYEDEFFNTSFYKDHQVRGHPISVVYSGMAKAITRLIEKVMVINYGYFNNYVG